MCGILAVWVSLVPLFSFESAKHGCRSAPEGSGDVIVDQGV